MDDHLENKSNVVYALIKRRSEMAGFIEHCRASLHKATLDLDALDATIRIFDPSVDIGEIRSKPMPPRCAAYKGEMTSLIFRELRKSATPLTSHDLACALLTERSQSLYDKVLFGTMVKRVCAALRSHRIKGSVEIVPSSGPLQAWQLKGDL